MLVGVPGCGKSLCAKAVAAEWRKPLLKFDLGRVFGSLVGEAEERMRKALSVAEGVAPCVLWIDELEKGLAGIGGGGDGGVATRVFGTLLTWMEEKTRPVFVVATANNIAQLPPELLRKGRLDEIFFVELPAPRNRAEILMIHLARRQRTPTDYDIAAVAHATDGFSGAELEEVVVNALFEAYSSPERELKTEHLLNAARDIKPLAHTLVPKPGGGTEFIFDSLRRWAAHNCRMAASAESTDPDTDPGGVSGRRKRLVDL
ncbi:MAG: AAA family ATPase [Burkholderiales bacterium]